jgi:hypothetical protein
MKVIGVGGPRTGTASLKDALEILGFGRCYHMEWLFNHQEDLKYWHELFDTGKTDFDRLFQGCQSTVDFPGYLNYKALYKQYPDAKFILNYRDPEAWYESAKHTVHSVTPQTIPQKLKMLRKMIFSRRFRRLAQSFRLVEKYLWKGKYRGNFNDREQTLEIFRSFYDEVKNTIPTDQLLVYKIADGWGPLCEFLDVPVPKENFPHKNQRKDFQEKFKTLMETGGELVLK